MGIQMYMLKSKAKRELVRAFKEASIFKSHQYNNKTHYNFPKIHDVMFNKKYIRYTFTLLDGIDPALLEKNWFVFEQIFGKNLKLDGDVKRFVLKVYYDGLPKKLDYVFEDWKETVDSMTVPIVCGLNLNGEQVAFDMDVYPHILLTGETGSGKSSLLRVILTSLMLGKTPEEVQFVLGDLKKAEFGIYRGIPHVQTVDTFAHELLPTMARIKKEMDRRGKLLDKHQVPHVKELSEKLPYLLVCIDEFAMLKKEKVIMQVIEDISSVGRSLGILLILSCQRADSKLMEGILKNNLTVRMAGRQSNKTNSKIAGVPSAHTIKMSEKGRIFLVLDDEIMIQSPHLEFKKAQQSLRGLLRGDTEVLEQTQSNTLPTQEDDLFTIVED